MGIEVCRGHLLTVIAISNLNLTIQKLRKVILEDQLGICAELDAMMDNLVNTYEDEWANVVKGLSILNIF